MHFPVKKLYISVTVLLIRHNNHQIWNPEISLSKQGVKTMHIACAHNTFPFPWLRELKVAQLQRTHANRKRKHIHQFDSRYCKCSQHKQINNCICSAFLHLVVLWACVVKMMFFLFVYLFFLFAARWARSATVLFLGLKVRLFSSLQKCEGM